MRVLPLLFCVLMPTLVGADTLPNRVPSFSNASEKIPAMTQLSPFAANYEVRLNNIPFKADARQTLSALGGNRWRLELRIESFLLDTVEFAEFRWDGENCHTIPERYGYSRRGVGRDRNVDMRFDFARHTVVRRDDKGSTSFTITDNAEDKLGHTLALACRIARGTRGETAIDVAWDYEMRHFDYRIGKTEEVVVTPLAEYRALRLERQRADSDRITTSWLSASSGWQAVQMQHNEGDGRLFQLRLLELDHAK